MACMEQAKRQHSEPLSQENYTALHEAAFFKQAEDALEASKQSRR